MPAIILISLLTFAASIVGTASGFGLSSLMVPVLLMFYPLHQVLLMVGIIHLFGDLWKVLLFRSGMRWRLIFLFGIPGIAFSYAGATLSYRFDPDLMLRVLGLFLAAYALFVLVHRRFKVRSSAGSAVTGGALSGFFAGLFGVGGAVRGAFLSAFDLPKAVYIATSGSIALFIDATRLLTYAANKSVLPAGIWIALPLYIACSFAGARVAKSAVKRIPQMYFRSVIAVVIFLISLTLIF